MKKFKISNKAFANNLKENYKKWKKDSLDNTGYFIIFKGFKDTEKLKKITGNALKLYVYLGLNSDNMTGEVWHSNAKIAKYFQRSERTIRLWMQELESLNLIKRMQINFNEESHTFLQGYSNYNSMFETDKYVYTYRLKEIKARNQVDLRTFCDELESCIKTSIKNAKVYVNVKEKEFQIISYSPVENKYLRAMSRTILKSIPIFEIFTKKYTAINDEGEEVEKRQLFERIRKAR